jgi:hypothetical protein
MAGNKMKEKCEGATWGLILEFEKQFLKHEIMIILRIVYPPFGL